ncbi:MAG: penicillin-binding protein 2 [Proteobacteria bacterium]|nr:penicillin-binding protein 2 [Pseudomonadota bacterium]MDA0957315.1 penicillin-binding protein 2 [Pseudomonadota bacterium]
MAEPLALKDHHLESQIYIERVAAGALVVGLLFLALLARIGYLQIYEYRDAVSQSEENRIQVVARPPVRGLILDAKGLLLADNRPSRDLRLIPEQINDVPDTLQKLQAVLEMSLEEVERFRSLAERQYRRFEALPVLFDLSDAQVAQFEANRYQFPGLFVSGKLVRNYPQGELVAHAVGSVRRINDQDAKLINATDYAGTDHIGKLGVERFYEGTLLGQVGYDQIEVNARGRQMQTLESVKPVNGRDLQLYLDVGLQAAADRALGDRRGAIVAIEPKSGGILALLSRPAYDPNLFVQGISHKAYNALRTSVDAPLFNRAIQGQYQPGSTLKPFIGLVALGEGFANIKDKIEDPGWYQLPGNERLYRDWNWTKTDAGGHGQVNLQKAIYRSCNVYFYDLAVRLGIDRLSEGLSRFGFGAVTVLDLPEASVGLLPSRDWKQQVKRLPWYPGDTVNLGIGHGDVLVTPLQMATAVATLANRGKFVRPRMVQSSALEQAPSPTQALGEPLSQALFEPIIEAMEMVVHRGNQGFGENGTAWAYIGRDIEYRMAGKSGTAQVVEIEQGEVYDASLISERQRKHAWFVAFAPVVAPEIAIAVLIENGGGGSEQAAPIARELLDYYLLESKPLATAMTAAGLMP